MQKLNQNKKNKPKMRHEAQKQVYWNLKKNPKIHKTLTKDHILMPHHLYGHPHYGQQMMDEKTWKRSTIGMLTNPPHVLCIWAIVELMEDFE